MGLVTPGIEEANDDDDINDGAVDCAVVGACVVDACASTCTDSLVAIFGSKKKEVVQFVETTRYAHWCLRNYGSFVFNYSGFLSHALIMFKCALIIFINQ